MTPGSSVGFGLGDRQVALDSPGHSKGMTGLPAEAAAQRLAGSVKPTCPARGAVRDTVTDPSWRPPGRLRGIWRWLSSRRRAVTTAPPVVASGLARVGGSAVSNLRPFC